MPLQIFNVNQLSFQTGFLSKSYKNLTQSNVYYTSLAEIENLILLNNKNLQVRRALKVLQTYRATTTTAVETIPIDNERISSEMAQNIPITATNIKTLQPYNANRLGGIFTTKFHYEVSETNMSRALRIDLTQARKTHDLTFLRLKLKARTGAARADDINRVFYPRMNPQGCWHDLYAYNASLRSSNALFVKTRWQQNEYQLYNYGVRLYDRTEIPSSRTWIYCSVDLKKCISRVTPSMSMTDDLDLYTLKTTSTTVSIGNGNISFQYQRTLWPVESCNYDQMRSQVGEGFFYTSLPYVHISSTVTDSTNRFLATILDENGRPLDIKTFAIGNNQTEQTEEFSVSLENNSTPTITVSIQQPDSLFPNQTCAQFKRDSMVKFDFFSLEVYGRAKSADTSTDGGKLYSTKCDPTSSQQLLVEFTKNALPDRVSGHVWTNALSPSSEKLTFTSQQLRFPVINSQKKLNINFENKEVFFLGNNSPYVLEKREGNILFSPLDLTPPTFDPYWTKTPTSFYQRVNNDNVVARSNPTYIILEGLPSDLPSFIGRYLWIKPINGIFEVFALAAPRLEGRWLKPPIVMDGAAIKGNDVLYYSTEKFLFWNDPSSIPLTPLGYPSCGDMFNGRLFLASSFSFPRYVWASQLVDVLDFTEPWGNERDAVKVEIQERNVTKIHSIVGQKQLFIFTDGGEFYIAASGSQLSNMNVPIRNISSRGILEGTQPVSIGNSITFMCQDRKNFYQIVIGQNQEFYSTVLNEYCLDLFENCSTFSIERGILEPFSANSSVILVCVDKSYAIALIEGADERISPFSTKIVVPNNTIADSKILNNTQLFLLENYVTILEEIEEQAVAITHKYRYICEFTDDEQIDFCTTFSYSTPASLSSFYISMPCKLFVNGQDIIDLYVDGVYVESTSQVKYRWFDASAGVTEQVVMFSRQYTGKQFKLGIRIDWKLTTNNLDMPNGHVQSLKKKIIKVIPHYLTEQTNPIRVNGEIWKYSKEGFYMGPLSGWKEKQNITISNDIKNISTLKPTPIKDTQFYENMREFTLIGLSTDVLYDDHAGQVSAAQSAPDQGGE